MDYAARDIRMLCLQCSGRDSNMRIHKNIRGKTKSTLRKASLTRHPAFGALKGLVHIPPGVDLTEPAEPEWEKLWLEANEWWINNNSPPKLTS